jgi:cytoskeletal protein RodZ
MGKKRNTQESEGTDSEKTVDNSPESDGSETTEPSNGSQGTQDGQSPGIPATSRTKPIHHHTEQEKQQIAQAVRGLAIAIMKTSLSDPKKAVLLMKELEDDIVRVAFINMFPPNFQSAANMMTMSKSEQAFLIVTFYVSFHQGYAAGQKDYYNNRSLHREILGE